MDLQKMIQETFPLYEDMDDMEFAHTKSEVNITIVTPKQTANGEN